MCSSALSLSLSHCVEIKTLTHLDLSHICKKTMHFFCWLYFLKKNNNNNNNIKCQLQFSFYMLLSK